MFGGLATNDFLSLSNVKTLAAIYIYDDGINNGVMRIKYMPDTNENKRKLYKFEFLFKYKTIFNVRP